MSRKWQQVKKWDAAHLTGPLAPLRWVLAALSSITLAVILLVFVAMYGALASIPIGLVALAPTWLVIILTATVAAVMGGGVLALLTRLTVPQSRPGWRYALSVLLGLAGALGGVAAWYAWVWPAMHYNPSTGEGLRFFASFVDAYDGTTLRRLPGVEMTELEFYSWWPLRVALILFVLNMIVATVRRIEFSFKNLGVLTVHTGIIVIALGSVYYQALKKEGDTLLRAGMPDQSGYPTEGQPERGFWDNTSVALWVAQRQFAGQPLWDERPLRKIPRYNNYNLVAGLPEGMRDLEGKTVMGSLARIDAEADRPLDLAVPEGTVHPMLGTLRVDEDIRFRVVGYAEYAQEDESLVIAPDAESDAITGGERTPIRVVELISRVPDEDGNEPDGSTPAFAFTLSPAKPGGRLSEGDALAVEYTVGMDPQRQTDLLATLPEPTPHALVIEVPAAAAEGGEVPRTVVTARQGFRHQIGDTGWAVGVREILPEPPFPIITEGYEGAQSSVAIVQITPPDGDPYDRYVYHRYPEINQDVLGTRPDGRPNRRDADPAIRVSYIDASKLQLYFNDRVTPGGKTETDLIIRPPHGPARLVANVGLNQTVPDVVDKIDFRVAERHENAVRVRHPVPVPELERDSQLIGTHSQALLGVEVSVRPDEDGPASWSRVVWVPYLQYLGTDPAATRTVDIPDGRQVTLQFGRVWHTFPGFSVQLLDFEMVAYDHRGAPRDYQSLVRVSPTSPEAREMFDGYQHVTKLNAPLKAPFIWDEERSLLGNIMVRLTNGLNPRQFKLSQAGWDREGWNMTQAAADRGELPAPFARFTILQVGNNPGIHVIALGGILMAVGIPWAFYVKPWLVRREKERFAREAKAKRGKATNESSGGDDASAEQEGAAQPAHQA